MLAALPWSVQKELIESLPRGGLQQQGHQAGTLQYPTVAQRLEAAAPGLAVATMAASAAAEAQQRQQQQQQQQPEPMPNEHAAGMGQQQEQPQQPLLEQQQQQRQLLKRSLETDESSDEEAGWEPDSQPEQPGEPMGAAAACGTSDAALAPQQVQPGGAPSHANEAGPSGSRPVGTPIAALPALSQVDPSVMDALPLEVRWELEQAYGELSPQSVCFFAAPCSSLSPGCFVVLRARGSLLGCCWQPSYTLPAGISVC